MKRVLLISSYYFCRTAATQRRGCLARSLWWLLGFSPTFLPVTTGAFFDPTTIGIGAQVVGGIIGGIDKADEVADIGFALGDLLSDMGIDPNGEGEMLKAIERIENLSSKAKELNWNSQDIKMALEDDLKSAKSVEQKIKSIRSMIAASKRIAEIMGVRPKAGEKAVSVQQIAISSMMLDELQSMRRAQLLANLKERRAEAERDIYMQEIRTGRRTSRNSGGGT